MEDQVAVAPLGTCNFALLERKDPAEIKKLLDVSISAGFFYLDFTSSQVESLPEQKGRLLEVMKGYFSQPMETKMLDSRNSTTRGFVSKGSFSAVDPNKSKESFEHLAFFYPGQLTHQKHTDIGSLTVLFSDEWGLQVVAPETRKWEWIEVRKYQAVINVGDTLRFFSDKKLYSCLHRVVREGRAAGEGHRYSIAYLLRPNDAAVFKDADGMQTTSKDFVRSKYQIYSASHSEQKGTVLTGGMEQVLGVDA
ncbi:putative 2og-fe oxygenase family protein [Diaporthe ampelina]|uniref:Putative 2og-fe oxygenase family protein n=1 Tax=Diaporthe ampelina TaxID=1214573 RepID=A0A0G2F546_9PEZI|nr:putative 2og-fe oxygenase family protein [Diaporthe ampelina]